jgi:hypothetical protein
MRFVPGVEVTCQSRDRIIAGKELVFCSKLNGSVFRALERIEKCALICGFLVRSVFAI